MVRWAVTGLGVLVVVATGACSDGGSRAEVAAEGPPTEAVGSAGASASPRLRVAIESRVPAIGMTVSDVREASSGELVHDLTFENRSDRVVYVDDPRDAVFTGDKELLVAFEGCGFATADGEAEPACRGSYRNIALAPGDTVTFVVSVYRDLPGMSPVRSESFVVERQLATRTTSAFDPAERPAPSGSFVLTYST